MATENILPEELLEDSSLWLRRVVWAAMGFNFGFILPIVVAFGLLPLLLPDYAPRRAAPALVNPRMQVAFVVVTNIPSATPIPPSPTATLAPPIVEEETPPPTEIAEQAAPPSAEPTLTPFPSATPVPPTPTPLPAPASYALTGITFQLQTWNNCGPANLAMGLSFYGWEGTQVDTARFLKPDREDKNVSPDQMVAYVNENTALRAVYRVAGSLDLLRWLVSNEFAVIVESGYEPPGEDWYGHYRTLAGYDDDLGEFYFYDSNLGRASRPRLPEKYAAFDRDWQAFNRTYIVIYPPEREAALQAFLGRDWNENANWRAAADLARQEASVQQDNAFAWFNLGTALTELGEYGTAAVAFDQAFNIGLPWRMMWYQFAPYEAYFQTSRLDDVVALAQATIRTTPYVEETYFYLGRVAEVRGNLEDAIAQYRTAVRYNSNFRAANDALARLEPA